uniref:(California timema) hypothetical protein n=1 Tax=Timema californicum TaxID=61474 RepID=A0A7R9JGJ2_TIMCA|nr:unnamed protein product [Timema californicum]
MIEQTALSNDTIRKRIHDMSIDITRQVMLFSDDTQLRAYIRSAAPTVMKEGLHAVVAALSVLGVLRARQGHCDVIMRRHGDVFFDVQVQPLHKGLLCRTPSLGRISLLSAPVSTGADPSCLPLHQKGLREPCPRPLFTWCEENCPSDMSKPGKSDHQVLIHQGKVAPLLDLGRFEVSQIMTDDKILESVVDEQQGDKEEDDETDEGMEDETRLQDLAARKRATSPNGNQNAEVYKLFAVKRLQDLAARKRATSPKQRMLFEMFQVLECRVCEDVFGLQGDKVPRLLYCGHTVCHACLLRLPLRDNMVQCPFDRQPTPTGKATNIIYYNVNSDWLQTEGGGYHFISPPIYYCNEWQSRETERHGMAWEETGELAKWAGTTEQYGI